MLGLIRQRPLEMAIVYLQTFQALLRSKWQSCISRYFRPTLLKLAVLYPQTSLTHLAENGKCISPELLDPPCSKWQLHISIFFRPTRLKMAVLYPQLFNIGCGAAKLLADRQGSTQSQIRLDKTHIRI